MFEHLTLTLAQQDGAPPPPASTPAQSPALPAVQTPAGTDQTTATTSNENAAVPPAAPESPFGGSMMFIVLAMLAVMVFFSYNTSRKDKKKKAALAASIKKGSKVRTIGGIMGTVVEMRDDHTVVLKVDENANTRIKFDRSAIAVVMEDKAD